MRTIIIFILLVLLTGCVTNKPMPNLYSIKSYNAPIGKQLAVETGESLFVDGEYIEGEVIIINKKIEKMIPGSMHIPFPITIDKGSLRLTKLSNEWRYYSAEKGKFRATFPGLGSVLREGDTIGIRISHDKTDKEWFVDNSNYNSRYRGTIWTKNLSQEEKSTFIPKPSGYIFEARTLKEIVFDGYYGGQVHFQWKEFVDGHSQQKDFIFDFNGSGTEVGINGNHFIIHSADNVKLFYEWIKIK
ncbi:MAG: hypothetical protein NUV86_08165 [Candidatus Scalindua sp.]|nr:hypothetical protein [Candidatus Scalindua sp.]